MNGEGTVTRRTLEAPQLPASVWEAADGSDAIALATTSAERKSGRSAPWTGAAVESIKISTTLPKITITYNVSCFL